LAFGVGAQPLDPAFLSRLRQSGENLIGQANRQRHHLGRLVAGVAEHQSLVPRAESLGRIGLDHAQCNVACLLADGDFHPAAIGVDSQLWAGVADLPEDVSGYRLEAGGSLAGDLAGDHHQLFGEQCLAGDAAGRVLVEATIEHRVGDLVGELVGVTLAD